MKIVAVAMILLGSLIAGRDALAVPEAARYGHFTCVSCHVSPGGSGVLTSYGRMFAADKLSTWHFDGEENPLHGLVPVSDRYLLGGDIRWADYRQKSDATTFEKFWRMQSDIEAGVHVGNVWVTATGGTKPAGPTDRPEDTRKPVVRGYLARVDLLQEHLVLRGGLFLPKYGLMLSDHTAWVRTITGLGPDKEQTQLEAIYQDDALEVSLAALVKDRSFDRENQSKSGVNAGAAVMFDNRHRLSANVLQTHLTSQAGTSDMLAFGVSSVVTYTRRLFSMLEVDRAATAFKAVDGSTSTRVEVAAFGTLSYETYRGILPYGRLEYRSTHAGDIQTHARRWGAGLNWYVRPHVQVDGRVLRSSSSASDAEQDESTLILHYYF